MAASAKQTIASTLIAKQPAPAALTTPPHVVDPSKTPIMLRIDAMSKEIADLRAANARMMADAMKASATMVHNLHGDMMLLKESVELAALAFTDTQITSDTITAIADRLLVAMSAQIGNAIRQELVSIMPKVVYNDGSQPGQRAKAETLTADELARITAPAKADALPSSARPAKDDEIKRTQSVDAKGNVAYRSWCLHHSPPQPMRRIGDMFMCSSCEITTPVQEIIGEMPKSKRGMGLPKEQVHHDIAGSTKPVSVVKAAQVASSAPVATPEIGGNAALLASLQAMASRPQMLRVHDAAGTLVAKMAKGDQQAAAWSQFIDANPNAGYSYSIEGDDAHSLLTIMRDEHQAPVQPIAEVKAAVASIASSVTTGRTPDGKGWTDSKGIVHPIFTGKLYETAGTPESIAFHNAKAAGLAPYATCSCGTVLSSGYKCKDGAKHNGNQGKGVAAI